MFAPHYGIAEDPATGSGAGCLVAYTLRHVRPDAAGVDLRIEQGYEMRRPSILAARGRRDDDGMRVAVGGRVVMVAQGQFV
jgi:trans-2,3-dihydro-3-hydroxyanthranilate isomerase